MTNCINEKKCHETCNYCEAMETALQENETLKKLVESYKLERQSLLETNWELNKKVLEAEKQIKCELDELLTLKNFLVELQNDYDELLNHSKTLEALIPKTNG